MKLLILAGPYEADRILRAATVAGDVAVAAEPGGSISGWITAARPDAIVLAPQIVNPDPVIALAKVRAVPRGRVPTFLVGDPDEEARMRGLADGFFARPVSMSDLLARVRERINAPESSLASSIPTPAVDRPEIRNGQAVLEPLRSSSAPEMPRSAAPPPPRPPPPPTTDRPSPAPRAPTLVDVASDAHSPKRRVFVCYRRRDSGYPTGHLSEILRASLGSKNVFHDVASIPLGTSFPEVIDQEMRRCSILLAIVGRKWLAGLKREADHVRVELEAAIRLGLVIIPVLVDEASLPQMDQLPTSLRVLPSLNSTFLRPLRDFRPDAEAIIRTILQHWDVSSHQLRRS